LKYFNISRRRVGRCVPFVLAVCLTGFHRSIADVPESAVSPVATPLWSKAGAPIEARVDDLFGRLNQEQKLGLFAFKSGSDPLKLDIPPISALGVPPLRTTDSPQAVRVPKSTAYPMAAVMASTWDPDLIRRVGAGIGMECRAKGRQVIYGPCINIHRTPQTGRFFENMSEDPFLTKQMAVQYIEGMQSAGTAACVKHFVCNNQETNRGDINVEVDERAFNEIYLPAFHASLTQAHAWAFMPSLNKVNGTYVSQSKVLIQDLVKTQWGWDGLAIGDWGSIHDTTEALNGGTDIEMPDPNLYTPAAIQAAIQSGKVSQALIDDKVRRIIRCMVRTGVLDGLPQPDESKIVNSPEHQAVALKVAQEGITLLKNAGGVLPLDRKKIKTIAVIGPNAQDTPLGGRWSADTTPFFMVNVVDGIKKAAGGAVTVAYAQGCPRFAAGTPEGMKEASDLAEKSDVAVVVVGMDNNYEGENMDPATLYLPGDQDKLIQAVAAANKHTIVVLNNGSPVLMDKWLQSVPGVLEAWYAGQDTGTAVASILFGDVNPSGKLADTLGARREDYGDLPNYPGSNGVVKYAEGIYVGYRHFDKANIVPLFPFGYGLSYTTFAYDRLRAPVVTKAGKHLDVHVRVKNTGLRAGTEVVQLYIRDLHPKIDRPVRELKGFARITLPPGKAGDVVIPVEEGAFSYWDVATHKWQANPGRYAIEIGASSRDIRVSAVTTLR